MRLKSMWSLAGCAAMGALLASGQAVAAPITLTQWTFETSQPSATNSPAITGIAAEVGTGNASGLHASAGTDYSNPVGNGSAESFSSNEWAIGDYYQFETSTLGQSGVQLSWAQTRSSTGPSDFKLEYSNDGVNFTQGSTYTVGTTSFSSGSFNPSLVYQVDLRSVTALNNQPTVTFRLTATSAPSSSGGTNRVDDFTVLVPEPATMALAGLGLVGLLAVRRRES